MRNKFLRLRIIGAVILSFSSSILASAENDGLAPSVQGASNQLDDRSLFGGEDILYGDPWYHEVFSNESAILANFSTASAEEIAWHADFVDSYTYNPLYWFALGEGGGLGRFKASQSIKPDLIKLHFDDLNTAQEIINAYYRYITGCLVGLRWAAEIFENPSLAPGIDPIGAAHNLLGVTLHAIQDFYSHSNWIDVTDRREMTFQEYTVCELKEIFLFTGAFEKDFGLASHGKYNVICSLVNAPAIGGFISATMDVYCLLQTTNNGDICMDYQDCDNPVSVTGGSIAGVKIPDNVMYYNPPGINLDNTWQAEIGVIERGIELTGAQAFNIAKNLAIKASSKWLTDVGTIVSKKMGHSLFWENVMNSTSPRPKEDQFEKFNHFPFQFTTAGPDMNARDDGFFLRVTIKTSSDFLSGTNADIKLIADGASPFDLDYMPGANPVIGYNDHEAGDEIVYTVGPFPSLPSYITLKNDAPSIGDILKQLGRDIINAFKAIAETVYRVFLNDADYVGTEGHTIDPLLLNSIGVGNSIELYIYINGGGAGKYKVHFQVIKLSLDTTRSEATYQVKITKLECVKESDVDSGIGFHDEPFFFAILSSYPGVRQAYRSRKFGGVDSGESRSVNYVFQEVTMPITNGAMVITFQIWESDAESANDHKEAFKEFQGAAKEEEDNFFIKAGEAIAADWKIDWIRVYAFRRGKAPQAGFVLHDGRNHWIEGGHSRRYDLQTSGLKFIPGFNLPPVARCSQVKKQTGTVCFVRPEAYEFDGGSTDQECSDLSFFVRPRGPFHLGTTKVLMAAVDDAGNTDTCETSIVVEDKTPPYVHGCSDVVVECSSAMEGTPKNDSQLVAFFDDVVASDVCDEDPNISNNAPNVFPVGETTIVQFTATDFSGNIANCDGAVTVADTMPPNVKQGNDTITLWPPNKKYYELDLLLPYDFDVSSNDDCCGAQNTYNITKVTSSESWIESRKKGKHKPTIYITGNTTFAVQAYRFRPPSSKSSSSDAIDSVGRKYYISYAVTDCNGLVTSSEVYVEVPIEKPATYYTKIRKSHPAYKSKKSKSAGHMKQSKGYNPKIRGGKA